MPDKPGKVGDKIRVSRQMHGGKIVDATITAVIVSFQRAALTPGVLWNWQYDLF
jgi:hypothetical protein